MLRRIQAKNFRCLHDIDVELDGEFHLLVGPNGAGKSALMDVLAFLGDFVSDGLTEAITKRTNNIQDLVWCRPRTHLAFELAAEFDIPEETLRAMGARNCAFRYEVAIHEIDHRLGVKCEQGVLISVERGTEEDRATRDAAYSLLTPGESKSVIFTRNSHGTAYFQYESAMYDPLPRSRQTSMQVGQIKSVLGALPDLDVSFPVSAYARNFVEGVVTLQLDGRRLRQASPPGPFDRMMDPAGANLPWMVQRLRKTDKDSFNDWLAHVRTGLSELADLRVVERPDDRHAYLMIRYRNGVEVPSWSVSEGTLRLLVLTLTAYLPGSPGIYLIEEPENGIHPLAVETAYQSLSSVYVADVFVATHSPTLLACAELSELLCFSKTANGSSRITPGIHHPRLIHWRGAVDTHLLFASDVLG